MQHRPILIFFGTFFAYFLAAGDARASCGNTYWIPRGTCNDITVQSQNIYGDPTGAVTSGAICFEAYFQTDDGPQLSYYVKYIQISSCDTSLGYKSTPKRYDPTICVGNPDNPTNTFHYYECVPDPCAAGCSDGQYMNGNCVCQTCPSADNFYVDSALSSLASTQNGITSNGAAALAITACYAKKTPQMFYDAAGQFHFSSNCYYSE